MTDQDFLRQIEACTLPKAEFTHRSHLRLAWLYLSDPRGGDPDTRIADTIQRYATGLGATKKYNHARHLMRCSSTIRRCSRLPSRPRAGYPDAL